MNKNTAKYVITGTNINGSRFTPIYTNKPQCYNIYRGTIWQLLDNGKRKKINSIWN